MSRGHFILVAISISSVVGGEVSLPPSIRICLRDSFDYATCLKDAIQDAWPTIVRGIPELSLPQLDPHYTDYMEQTIDVFMIRGRGVIRNATISGMTDAQFLSVRPHYLDDRHRLDIDFQVPKLFAKGDFKASASVMGFQLIGAKGQFNATAESIRGILSLDGNVIDDRWVLEDLTYMPQPKMIRIWASDLFNGNKMMTQVVLNFINESWQMLYMGVLPHAAEIWNEELKKLVNDIFSKLTFSKTFP